MPDGHPGPLPGGDRLLTQEEAAELLQVNVRSVQTERYACRLGWVKVAGKVRIPMSAITAFLAAYRVEPVVNQPPALVPIRQPRRRMSTGIGGKTEAEHSLEKLRARIRAMRKTPTHNKD